MVNQNVIEIGRKFVRVWRTPTDREYREVREVTNIVLDEFGDTNNDEVTYRVVEGANPGREDTTIRIALAAWATEEEK